MGDFHLGYCDAGDVPVSQAVAASSAFPPGFSALRLKLPTGRKFSRVDPWGEAREVSGKRAGEEHGLANQPPLLTDGGVYDNLGVEPVWRKYKTLLVSDAGQPFESVAKSGQSILSRLYRASQISMEQVGAVRKRWLVDAFVRKQRQGTIWTLNTRLEDFPLQDRSGYGQESRKFLHKVRTDLNAFTAGEIACLENHGYSMADAALRSRAPSLCTNLSAPFRWPNEEWSDEVKVARALCMSDKRRIARDIAMYVAKLGT